MMNTNHWKRLKEKTKIPSEIRKLRVCFDQYLDTQEFYQKAMEEYEKAHRSEIKEVPNKSVHTIIPKEPNPGETFEPPPSIEFESESHHNKNLDNLPNEISSWLKKIYRWTALQYHPDKNQNSNEWFSDWLNAYNQGDWIMFFIFLENIEELWAKYPPPEVFKYWVMQYVHALLGGELKIVNQKEYQWWNNKLLGVDTEENQ